MERDNKQIDTIMTTASDNFCVVVQRWIEAVAFFEDQESVPKMENRGKGELVFCGSEVIAQSKRLSLKRFIGLEFLEELRIALSRLNWRVVAESGVSDKDALKRPGDTSSKVRFATSRLSKNKLNLTLAHAWPSFFKFSLVCQSEFSTVLRVTTPRISCLKPQS